VLTAIIVVIQVLCCLALIFLILMHSGRGGGLSDMFGGSMGQAAAIIFGVTNIVLLLRLK
jgi:preprotein translocase subunit SecG